MCEDHHGTSFHDYLRLVGWTRLADLHSLAITVRQPPMGNHVLGKALFRLFLREIRVFDAARIPLLGLAAVPQPRGLLPAIADGILKPSELVRACFDARRGMDEDRALDGLTLREAPAMVVVAPCCGYAHVSLHHPGAGGKADASDPLQMGSGPLQSSSSRGTSSWTQTPTGTRYPIVPCPPSCALYLTLLPLGCVCTQGQEGPVDA